MTIAKDGLRCDSLLKYNTIEKNKDNGILCAGKENYTRIENNNIIKSNRRSGIKALEFAHITVINNTIESNFAQGILLVESTSGHIEMNSINTNYKANIAFGGENSWDTVIHRNEIFGSRSEGIFVIESGFAWISHNNIYDNNDGIILFDSCPWISSNKINENQRSGVILSGSSYPMLDYNHIYGNASSGVILRDNSSGDIKNNKVGFFSNIHRSKATTTNSLPANFRSRKRKS